MPFHVTNPSPPLLGPERPDLPLLRQMPIFSSLDDAVLHRISGISSVVTIEEGAALARQGDLVEYLYVVVTGQVAISNEAPNGDNAVVEVVPAGGHLFLSSVLSGLPLLVSGHAITGTRLIAVAAAGLMEMIRGEPSLVTALLRAEAMDFRQMVRQVCDLKLRTTAQRLGCYLLELSKDPGALTAAMRLPFDKRLLAARLGCRQENLSRAFASLRDYGVETHGARVILHDIPKLRGYSVPDELADVAAA